MNLQMGKNEFHEMKISMVMLNNYFTNSLVPSSSQQICWYGSSKNFF